MKRIVPLGLVLLACLLPGAARAALPSPWVDHDIGAVGVAGSTAFASGVFTVKGAGADIFGSADGFNYCSQTISGNFVLVARLTGAGGTSVNGGAASGIMLRETTAANSRHVMIYAEPGAFNRYVDRLVTGATSTRVGIKQAAFPLWLQIVRNGSLVRISSSPDGTTWTLVTAISLENLAASVQVGMAVTARNNSVLNTATFDNVSVSALPASGSVTSWIGNSWPGGGQCVGYGVASIYVDPATGFMAVNGQSEAVSTTLYDTNGNFVAPCSNSHFNGGYAIAADATRVYASQSPGSGGVAVYDHNGFSVASVLLPGKLVRGLACNRTAGQLYIAEETSNPNLVHVFSTSTLTELRSFALARPRNMAVDPSGNLWIIQDGDGGANAPKVLHYGPTGTVLSGEIDEIPVPRGIAVDQNGLVYVTDCGTDMNLKVFNANGMANRTYGVLHGVYEINGSARANYFNYPVGVGVDNSGNIWVACNGPKTQWADLAGGTGAVLTKFNAAFTALWQRFGLAYVDCASADPGNDGSEVYTKDSHYTMLYNRGPGADSTYRGITIDAQTYPNDARLTQKAGPAWVRRINGDLYLFVSDQQSGFLWYYAFQTGEFAAPIGSMQRETDRGHSDNHFGIWHDLDGDGTAESGEIETTGAPAGPPSNETFCYSVDSSGAVWTMDGTKVRRYAPQFDADGILYYTNNALQTWSYPAAFTGTGAILTRAYYDPAADALYLSGYTNDAPKTDTAFGLIGTRIIRYNTFLSTGTAHEAYRITVPRNAAANIGARAMDIAGSYVGYVLGNTAEVDLFNAATGAPVQQLFPGSDVGVPGIIDCNNGLQLFVRSTGEVLSFVEEDNEAKVLMFRYMP